MSFDSKIIYLAGTLLNWSINNQTVSKNNSSLISKTEKKREKIKWWGKIKGIIEIDREMSVFIMRTHN